MGRILNWLRPTKKKTAATIVAAVMALAVPLTETWEGLRVEAYQDVVGVWTVCYGETEGVKPGDTYTPDECKALLERRLVEDYYLPVVACAPELAQAPVEVQAAITSWTYNVGVGAACGSTLIRKLRAGDLVGACNELPRWNRAGGRVWQGLVNRRADERGLCLSGAER
jgi:GH24 family phage-related lysozyme (muramidase)